ncbi:MAG: hypothetical protein LBK62_13455, partial [Treponema sp.]|nr:hypothetical protein [Treponema sp.]
MKSAVCPRDFLRVQKPRKDIAPPPPPLEHFTFCNRQRLSLNRHKTASAVLLIQTGMFAAAALISLLLAACPLPMGPDWQKIVFVPLVDLPFGA